MTNKRKILVTSALLYANGLPHLGHLVGTIQGDIWVRFQRMQGHECIYISGSDSHGTPIMIKAEQEGITPIELINHIHQQQNDVLKDFLIAFDNYYPTHSKENETLMGEVFEKQQAAGNIAKRVIKQYYDPVKEMFLPDRYIKGECPNCGSKDQYGDNCEVCGAAYLPTDLKNPYSVLSGSPPIEKDSEHYFFKLQNFTDFLQQWMQRGHLQEQVVNKLKEWFKDGLKEWDISRDAPYFGFLIPGEDKKYFYVWLDAPVGYMGIFKNLCEKQNLNFLEYWGKESKTELVQFIGKDIVYFHGLFWPAILAGAGFRTPTTIFVNGFLTVDGQKMSKSRGTFIHARTYLNHLPPEYLRYYFAAKLSDRIEDLDINFDDFLQRINADLVGKYINIASRCAGFITKYFDNKLSEQCDKTLYTEFANQGNEIAKKFETLEYSQAVRAIMSLADQANQYIDEKKPWSLVKSPEKLSEVQAICTMGINFFRLLTIYLKPILPETAERVEAFLNIPPLKWQDKDSPILGCRILPYQPLLQRIDPKQIEALKMEAKPAATEVKEATIQTEKKYISIDDFNKIDLRIAKVIEAEQVEGADKLLRLKVDLGSDDIRQIFAGIKSAYEPADLIGRQVVVVANLAPRKMRFGLSEGMVIVAKGDKSEKLWIVSPDEGAEEGMQVK